MPTVYEWVTCPVCGRFGLSTGQHKCAPLWLVWNEDHQEGRDGLIPPSDTEALEMNGAHKVRASSATDAAEEYSDWCDNFDSGFESYRIVFVRPYDDEDATPVRVEVNGELVRNYTARVIDERGKVVTA